ncbi:MAG: hypothetical protein WKF47_11680 [Geodermatophilaceae bacterium]
MLSDLRESGCLPASTRILRADTGAEVTIGSLFASGERDVPVWSLDDRLRLVPKAMAHAFSSGIKEVFRLRLTSGREIEATANHPFLTMDGWIPAARTDRRQPRRRPPPRRRTAASGGEFEWAGCRVGSRRRVGRRFRGTIFTCSGRGVLVRYRPCSAVPAPRVGCPRGHCMGRVLRCLSARVRLRASPRRGRSGSTAVALQRNDTYRGAP